MWPAVVHVVSTRTTVVFLSRKSQASWLLFRTAHKQPAELTRPTLLYGFPREMRCDEGSLTTCCLFFWDYCLDVCPFGRSKLVSLLVGKQEKRGASHPLVFFVVLCCQRGKGVCLSSEGKGVCLSSKWEGGVFVVRGGGGMFVVRGEGGVFVVKGGRGYRVCLSSEEGVFFVIKAGRLHDHWTTVLVLCWWLHAPQSPEPRTDTDNRNRNDLPLGTKATVYMTANRGPVNSSPHK